MKKEENPNKINLNQSNLNNLNSNITPPIIPIQKNFTNQIEIDTLKIKYPLMSKILNFYFLVKFKYSENDVFALYETLLKTTLFTNKPNFNNIQTELISDKNKELNKNLFSFDKNNTFTNHTDKANTYQLVHQIRKNTDKQSFKFNENINKNNNFVKATGEKILEKNNNGLNVNGSTFIQGNYVKTSNNETPVGNSKGVEMPYNKFDEFDPSSC